MRILIRANIAELGADFTPTLKNGGWWDENATGSAPPAPAGLLNDIASRAALAQTQGSGEFQPSLLLTTPSWTGANAHLPWAQSLRPHHHRDLANLG